MNQQPLPQSKGHISNVNALSEIGDSAGKTVQKIPWRLIPLERSGMNRSSFSDRTVETGGLISRA